jgi:hypothetical protein
MIELARKLSTENYASIELHRQRNYSYAAHFNKQLKKTQRLTVCAQQQIGDWEPSQSLVSAESTMRLGSRPMYRRERAAGDP